MQRQSVADDAENDDNDGDEPKSKEALHRYGLVRLWVRVIVGVEAGTIGSPLGWGNYLVSRMQ